MASAAVLGAAAGTGLALVVAVTIVVYRYYSAKRLGKYWSTLDRWPDPPASQTIKGYHDIKQGQHHSHNPTGAHVLDCWRKPPRNYYAVQSRVRTIFFFIHNRLTKIRLNY